MTLPPQDPSSTFEQPEPEQPPWVQEGSPYALTLEEIVPGCVTLQEVGAIGVLRLGISCRGTWWENISLDCPWPGCWAPCLLLNL